MKAAGPKCRKLLECYRKRDFILDDESYFTLSNSTLAGNDRFYSQDKVLVAIYPRGKTKALFLNRGLAMPKEVYQNECLDHGLIPFIRK